MSLDSATFLLAMAGYAGLSATVLLSARGRLPRGVWRVSALVIAAHIVLVWVTRTHGQLSQATRQVSPLF